MKTSATLPLLLAGCLSVGFELNAQDPTSLEGVGDTIPGFVILGAEQDDRIGNSVAVIPDVNGDGLADILIGAERADVGAFDNAGSAFLVFGKTDTEPVDLANLGDDGIRYNGVSPLDATGYAVSSAGDFNGDGLGDFAIGARQADPNGVFRAGQGYVVFGSTNLPSGPVDLGSLAPPDGFIVEGVSNLGDLGTSVSPIGDFNGDGYDDVLFSAPGGGGTGQDSYVIFGNEGPYTNPLSVGDLVTSGGGMTIDAGSSRTFGVSVAGVGDMNGDGISDILIGASRTGEGGDPLSEEGSVHVFFGATNLPPALTANALIGSNGFSMIGEFEGGQLGRRVSAAGDVNGDGFMDMLAGAPFSDVSGLQEAGVAYLIYGRDSFPADLDINSGSTSVIPFSNDMEAEWFGRGLAPGGDWNRDGLHDFAIGAELGAFNEGLVYTTYGDSGSNPSLGSEDVYIGEKQNIYAGAELGGGLDVNGDGRGDIAIGATNFSIETPEVFSAGKVYVITGLGPDAVANEPYTHTAYLPRGETPLLPVGNIGTSSSLASPSRFWIGFDGGFGSGVKSSSLVTIDVDPAFEFEMPAPDFTPGTMAWSLSIDRQSSNSYSMKYQYQSTDYGLLNEGDLKLYQLVGAATGWQEVQNAVFNTEKNTVTVDSLSDVGIFAFGTDGTVPSRIDFSFQQDEEGWFFIRPGVFSDTMQGYYGASEEALIAQTFDNNVTPPNLGSFGFWESPLFAITDAAANKQGDTIPISGATGEISIYAAEFNVSNNLGDPTLAPVYRFRSSSFDFQRSDVLVSTSHGNTAAYSPTSAGETQYTQIWTQPFRQNLFRLDFDVLNADPSDAAAVTSELRSVTVHASGVSELSGATRVALFEFTNSDTSGWSPRVVGADPSVIADAEVLEADNGLYIQGLTGNGRQLPPVIFGYWGIETSVPFIGGSLYRVSWRLTSDATASNYQELPVFRLRVNDSSLAYSSYVNIDSFTADARIPYGSTDERYDQYIYAPDVIDGNNWVFSFDYLFVDKPVGGDVDDPTLGIKLERVEIIKYSEIPGFLDQ